MTRRPSSPATACIIGGGPAGLVVAAGLVRRGVSVTLLESGNRSHNAERQQLSAASITGDELRAFQPIANRTRRLGGNANAWVVKTAGTKDPAQMGLRFGCLCNQDFLARPWLENSGWPISLAELDPWFRSAHDRFAIGVGGYHATPRTGALASLFAKDFKAKNFRFGLRDRLRNDLIDELEASPLACIDTDSTVTRLWRSVNSDRVRAATVRSSNGQERTIVADTFVLACGAVENARLLLASDPGGPGIGNEFDNVGRYLMDHPMYSIGHIEIEDPEAIGAFDFFDLEVVDDEVRHGYAAASPALCKELGSVQIALSLFPRPNERHVDAAEALKQLVQRQPATRSERRRRLVAIGRGASYFPRAAYNSIVRHRSLLPGFGRGGWGRAHDGMNFTRLEVVFQCEQPPIADSRVLLGDERDAYGSRLPIIDWHCSDQVKRSALAVQGRLADHITASGLGTYVPRAGSFDELGPPTSMAHHLGTTRMSARPEDGVVDADCRVHSVDNLYIAGSSVFPTSGYINPTLTIVALAERLADRISNEVQPPAPMRSEVRAA